MKVIICDDNPREQEKYAGLLHQLAKKHGVNLALSTYSDAPSLMFAFKEPDFTADLIYMDIHMPGVTGDQAAQQLRDAGYMNDIIFLTVSRDYYEKAFDVGALHYVVKDGNSMEKFENSFVKALTSKQRKEQEYVIYHGGGETRTIPVSSIRYFEIYREIVTVYYGNGSSFQFPGNLSELENDLSANGFFRIHKSYLVALAAIESLVFREITLRDGTKLPVGRQKYAELKETLNSWQIGTAKAAPARWAESG